MSYRRVIPRDLFNEANLLKCLGQLWIALDNHCNHTATFTVSDVSHFDIQQDESDGSISVANLPFVARGMRCKLSRPLNSRQPWPLYLGPDDPTDPFDVIAVFDEHGHLSKDMIKFITD